EPDIRKRRDALINGFKNKMEPLSQNTILRRQMANDAFPFLLGDKNYDLLKDIYDGINIEANIRELNKRLTNATIQDKAFMSTTYSESMSSFATLNGIEFRIYAPQGSKIGLFVDSVSQFRNEQEFLVKNG